MAQQKQKNLPGKGGEETREAADTRWVIFLLMKSKLNAAERPHLTIVLSVQL